MDNMDMSAPNNSSKGRCSIKVPVFGEIPLHPSEMLADLKVGENPPLWAQFFKYIICGFLGAAVFFGIYALVRIFYGDYLADSLSSEVMKSRLTRVFIMAFVIANVVSYFTNWMFVFTPSGRSRWVEFGFFILVAAGSFYIGDLAKDWFIDLGLHKDLATLSFGISSAVVNFVARKYLVFNQKPTGSLAL